MSADTEQSKGSASVRKQLTLTERHAEKLQKFAHKYHGGNQSQFVRSAIDDYVRSRKGQNELSVEKIRQSVEDLRNEFEKLEKVETTGNGGEVGEEEPSDEVDTSVNEVQKALFEAETPLQPDELADRTGISLLRTLVAAEKLVKKGHVHRVPEELPEYQTNRPDNREINDN